MHLYIYFVMLSRVSFLLLYIISMLYIIAISSGFGVGYTMIDPYLILAMPFNFILSSNLSFVLSKYPVFIMAMPLDFSYV